MTGNPCHHEPRRYRLQVGGHLDHHWACWFGDLTLTYDDEGTTSLTGLVCDQAELHGLLVKIRDLGITLIGVETLAPSGRVDRSGAGERCVADERESHERPTRRTT